MKLTYTVGDATDPQRDGNERAIIVHCCNDVGAWGAGFVMALSKKWEWPELYYREWAKYKEIERMPFKLGQVNVVPVEKNIAVANLIGQSGCGDYQGLPPIRYGAIHEGLLRLKERMGTSKWSLHMPRMGCGLAGGKWPKIEDILQRVFGDTNIRVTVYDFTPVLERPLKEA